MLKHAGTEPAPRRILTATRAVIAVTLLALVLSGCGSGVTMPPDWSAASHKGTPAASDPAAAAVPPEPALDLPPLREAATASEAVSGLCRGLGAASVLLGLQLMPAASGKGKELWAEIAGQAADIFVELPLESVGHGTHVEWPAGFESRFIGYVLERDGKLHVGLSGKLRSSIRRGMQPDEVQRLLDLRQALTGRVLLCRITKDEGSRPAMRQASAWPFTAPPELTVSAVGGGYQLGWPSRLTGDLDQNGEVNISDLTPIGILFGMKRGELPEWLLDAHRRVDCDGNGEINISDLTPIGMNFGLGPGSYRLERSLGTSAGPSATWAVVAQDVAPAGVTRFGSPVRALGGPPYPQVSEAAQPGFAYYRLTQVRSDGVESAPGDAVAAPDIVAPQWPGGDSGAALTLDATQWPTLTFNTNITDDRGGAIEYQVQVRSGETHPPELLPDYKLIKYNYSCADPITSPYDFKNYYEPDSADPPTYFPFKIAHRYYFQLVALDGTGNATTSPWLLFENTDYERIAILPGTYLDGDLRMWVSRDGSVKVVIPPLIGTDYVDTFFMGYNVYYYTAIGPRSHGSDYDEVAEFDPASRVEYQGERELIFPQALQKGEQFYFCFQVTDGGVYPDNTFISIPRFDFWLEPFEPLLPLESNFKASYCYADDGTPFFLGTVPGSFKPYLFTFKGGSFYQEAIPLIESSLAYPKRVPGTSEFLLTAPSSEEDEKLLWWQPGSGKRGYVQIPRAQLPIPPLGFDSVGDWVLEDADTAIGVRCKAKEQPEGGLGLEMWEAKRDGSYGVREILRPPGLTSAINAWRVWHANGKLVLEMYTMADLLSPPDYSFAVRDEAGEWTAFEGTYGLPSGIVPAGWENAKINGWEFGDPDTYVVVEAVDDASLPSEDQTRYTAVLKGDIAQGLNSFTKLWESRSDEALDPAYHGLTGRISYMAAIQYGSAGYYFHPAFPHCVITGLNDANDPGGYPLVVIGPDGRFKRVFKGGEDFPINSFSATQYFENGQMRLGLASGVISPDGQWMTWGGTIAEQVMGLAVKLD